MNAADNTRSTPADWPDRARAAVREAMGDRAAAAVAGTWAAREADPEVNVVLYGPQNAGKTSLLRRLLAEDGTPVPAWATVSGGKETYEAGGVGSAGLRYVDTPGVQAGDPLHTERAVAALLEADALLLVLGRRLFGGAAGEVLPLVTGTAVHPDRPRPYPVGALLPVVCKADRWGKEPGSEEFADEVEAVRGEFREQLGAHMDARHLPELHVVVADYYGLSTPIRPADLRRDHYLSFGGHDGVEALWRALRTLPGRRAQLRAETRVRYWCRAAVRALEAARAERERAGAARDGARRVDTRFALLENRLDELREAGRVELRAAVREELLRAADSAASAGSAEEAARERLATAVRGWQARWTGKAQQLALQGRAEAMTVRTVPGTQAFLACIDDVRAVLATAGDTSVPASRSAVPEVTTAVVLGLGPLAHIVQHELGKRRRERIGEVLEQRDGAADPGTGQGRDAATTGQASDGSDPYAYALLPLPGAPDVSDAPGRDGPDAPEGGAGGSPGPVPGTSDPADPLTAGDPATGGPPAGDTAPGGPAPDGPAAGDAAGGDSVTLFGEQLLVIAVSEIRDLIQSKLAEQAENRRAERREAAGKATERIAAMLEAPWLEELEKARAGLSAQRPDAATMALVEEEWAHLDRAVKGLEQVLGEAPL
ncbi:MULTISPECIES: GTPase domain-containing protein [unclassified Streptomyces]|uniref:GTPase domain-containing protein n=1 Tax=unclassified Streptomyces TaxID=2593676 RepID=UPI00073C0556|nr:GTPase domain-containing protein [Streptomyces sp. AVP053U2]ODA75675.1 hypothetical protein APS67_000238 [Streptomyces sp. AVP053U2]